MKKGGAIELLVILIIVVITSATVLFLVKFGIIKINSSSSKEAPEVLNTNFLPIEQKGFISIKQFNFCKDYLCNEFNNVFTIGDKIFFSYYVVINSAVSKTRFVRNYQLFNPDGDLILDFEIGNNKYVDEKLKKGKGIFKVIEYIETTEDFVPGVYVLRVLVKDEYINQKIVLSKKFVLEEDDFGV